MVDEYTRGGIRRKRPVHGDPEETFAKAARKERKARLRVPLREQVAMEGVHGELDGTKADIRDRENDSRREKNASIRDREIEEHDERRARVLEKWADKAGRKAIIEARQHSELRRNAMIAGEGLPEFGDLPDIASAQMCQQLVAKDEVRARNKRKPKEPPLVQQLEEHGEAILPTKFRTLVEQTRTSGTSKRAK